MLETKRAAPGRQIIKALLLSLLDFAVIQIELNDVAQQAVYYDGLLLTWIFPSPSTVVPFVLWLGLLLLRLKAPDKAQVRSYAYDWAFAAVFSLILLLGHSFWVCNSYTLLTANRSCKLLALFSLAGLTGLTVNLLRWAKYGCRKLMAAQVRLPKLWDRHPFLFPFVVIFLLWLPYAILKYPGGIDFDTYYQLLQPSGYTSFSNHNPLLSTLFFGYGLLLGKTLLGSYNAGLFFVILCQMLVCAACLAYSVKALHRLSVRPVLLWLSLGVYSLSTLVSRYCTSLGKDALFACVAVMYVAMLAELILGAEPKMRRALPFALLTACMAMLRSSITHLLALSCVLLLINWLLRRRRGLLTALMGTAGAYALCLLYLYALLPALGIPDVPSGDALSLPLMQTARYVKYYPEEVTEEERQIIDQVVEYDKLAGAYKERLSDYVKGMYRGDGESLARYFKVWAEQGLRHPEVYFSATFNNVYGYFYPGAREDAMGIYMQYDPAPDAPVQLFSLPEEAAARRAVRLDKLSDFIQAFENFPLFYPVCNAPVQFWLLIYLVLLALTKKGGALLHLLLPSAACILVCIAGPTFFHNGLRYGLLTLFANPFLFSVCLQKYIPNSNT